MRSGAASGTGQTAAPPTSAWDPHQDAKWLWPFRLRL